LLRKRGTRDTHAHETAVEKNKGKKRPFRGGKNTKIWYSLQGGEAVHLNLAGGGGRKQKVAFKKSVPVIVTGGKGGTNIWEVVKKDTRIRGGSGKKRRSSKGKRGH